MRRGLFFANLSDMTDHALPMKRRSNMSNSKFTSATLQGSVGTIVIVVAPCEGGQRGGFSAHLEANGQLLVRSSRQPFLDAARELIAQGHDPSLTLIMRHRGSDVPALRASIGTASRLTVDEDRARAPRIKRWKPFYVGAGSSRIAARGTPRVFVTPLAKAA
jgi:hypothetical protein